MTQQAADVAQIATVIDAMRQYNISPFLNRWQVYRKGDADSPYCGVLETFADKDEAWAEAEKRNANAVIELLTTRAQVGDKQTASDIVENEHTREYMPNNVARLYLASAITAALAAAEERGRLRERAECAEVAEHLNGWGADCGRGGHATHIAAMIRARSAPQPVAPQGGTAADGEGG